MFDSHNSQIDFLGRPIAFWVTATRTISGPGMYRRRAREGVLLAANWLLPSGEPSEPALVTCEL